jgi:hypothetical protein
MNYEDILKYNLERLENAFPNSKTSIGITKEQLAKYKQCSIATIDRAIMESDFNVIPDYIKGKGKNGRIFFPFLNIAMYLTEQTVMVVR